MQRPQTPTAELVNQYVQKFDAGGAGATDRALAELLRTFPANTQFEHILIKVVTVNSLYATGILAVGAVTAHILSHNIDMRLDGGAPELVENIARVEVKEGVFRRNYSFASKYCSWHNPAAYPIFDSFVERLIWQYQVQDNFSNFKRGSLWSYPTFKNAVEAFRTHYRLTDFSFKQLDKFLWMYGKELAQS